MSTLKNPKGVNYSNYKCPYDHIEKECGHELHGPEGYENTYSVWCACGFSGPAFCLDPEELKLARTKKYQSRIGREKWIKNNPEKAKKQKSEWNRKYREKNKKHFDAVMRNVNERLQKINGESDI